MNGLDDFLELQSTDLFVFADYMAPEAAPISVNLNGKSYPFLPGIRTEELTTYRIEVEAAGKQKAKFNKERSVFKNWQ